MSLRFFSRSAPVCHSRSGFTLIELLVVIAIIAILAVVVILTLNPAELLRQSRDSNRLSDMSTLQTALGAYVADTGGSLGSSGVTYISIPDPAATSTAGTDCSGLGFQAGGAFHCAASSTLRKTDGTGWIPVNFQAVSFGSPLGQLPIDPVNTASSNLYYAYETNGATWKAWAIPESQKYASDSLMAGALQGLGGNFPSGWVAVPGNSTFGTQNFYVMKYDAKCIDATTNQSFGTPGAAYDSGYRTYYDSNYPCTSANGKYIASTPDGFPIAYITHDTAKTYCADIGAHLLTNDEYMTIVRNAEQVNSNWSGGSPGSGYMYSGHNDGAPGYALPADSNDANGYSGETNTGGNQRRTLTLSNGSVVWDFAGNVWQHVQRSVNNAGDLTTTMALPACSNGTAGWEWCEYASPGSPYVSAWSSDVAQSKVGPSNTSWYSSQGIGMVYTYGTGANQGTTVFIRGAFGYGSNAGPFALGLVWGTGTADSVVGFRCAR